MSTAPIFDGTGTPVSGSLTANTTYYVELGSEQYPTSWYQFVYDAAIAITSITFASTLLPRSSLTTYAAAADGWVTETDIESIAVVAGTAGTVMRRCAGNGAPRQRAVIAVGATGGALVVYQHHKAA